MKKIISIALVITLQIFSASGAFASAQSLQELLNVWKESNYSTEALINVDTAIRNGSDTNEVDALGETPLMKLTGVYNAETTAAGRQDIENIRRVIVTLIAYGARVNDQDKKGDTALHKVLCNKEFAKALIDHNANADITNLRGENALHALIAKTDLVTRYRDEILPLFYDLAEYLIDHTKDLINQRTAAAGGETVLITAMRTNLKESFFKTLTNQPKDLGFNIRDAYGWDAFSAVLALLSWSKSYDSLAAAILAKSKLDPTDINYQNALNGAIYHNYPLTYREMLKAGFNPRNQDTIDGNNALMAAILSNSAYFNAEAVNLIGKVDIRSQNFKGDFPIHAAALKSNLKVAHALVLAGADLNAKNFSNITPLMYLAEKNRDDGSDIAILNEFLSQHACVNSMDINGRTALSIAYQNHKVVFAEILRNAIVAGQNNCP